MGRLDGKVAAVTGGASGIGEATVRRFVAEGASVAFCDRDGERGQRVAAELETAGAKVAFTHADVGTEAACLGFVNGAAQKFGRLDILINNAGIPQIREGRRGERGELERDPQRQPDELRLLCQGGGSADAPQQGWRHR
jgi:NAD(P)-dependent dehydrogenase (short-subunit alcohol dehydrogenase family)